MGNKWLFIIILPIILNCAPEKDQWKDLDLGPFKMSIPSKWNYVKERGEDSFVGKIVGPKITLEFDFSSSGYANSLFSSEQEYMNKKEWQHFGYFYKTGVIYTADFDVKKEKAAQMKKLGTTDSTLVHVEADPSYQTKTVVHLPTKAQKVKFPNADYVADLTFRDSMIYVPIVIPLEIKSHYIKVDSTEEYIIKTIWPKVPSKGITGIYFKGRSSGLTFNMVGVNLSKQDEDLALRAFKTISIK